MKIKLTDTMFLKNGNWILSNTHQTKVVNEWTNPTKDKRTHFEKFINFLDGVKTYQIFDDKKTGMPAKIIHGATKEELTQYNRKGYGIYLTVNETNGKGRTAKDVVRVRALFADLDGAPINPVLDYSPHLVVETSQDRYHAYWLVSDCTLDAFRDCQKSLIEKFDSDPVVHDLSRVMRVPGFYHMKGKPYPVAVVHEGTDQAPLTYEEFINIFPPKPKKKWSAEKFVMSAASDTGDYKGQYGTSEGDRNHSCLKIIGGMLKRGLEWSVVEAEVWKHGKACSPAMRDREIEHVLRSGGRYR